MTDAICWDGNAAKIAVMLPVGIDIRLNNGIIKMERRWDWELEDWNMMNGKMKVGKKKSGILEWEWWKG